MSRTLQPTPAPEPDAPIAAPEIVWPEFAPSPGHRSFVERLRRARIECGLSLCDMAELVGLYPKLAHEFENLITPLPFSHLEIWCQTVGVPFEDYLAVYWAEMEVYFEAQEREAEEKVACITNTENSAPTPAPSNENVNRGGGWLSPLRSVAAHIRSHFLSRFSIPKETPK